MPKIRVLVVDDAVVMRKIISDVISRDPELEVAAVAANGKIALQRIPQVNPDVVTLDVEMPEMDGVTTVREIRKVYPKLPVVMFSTLTQRGAEVTLDALSAGANDYVTKPANVGSVTESMNRLATELLPRLKSFFHPKSGPPPLAPGPRVSSPVSVPVPTLPLTVRPARGPRGPIEVVCVGTSTGGPNALADVFGAIRKPLPVPMVIVQHMPPVFTKILAERLAKIAGLPVVEGSDGVCVEPGGVYLAPGGKHMEVRKDGNQIRLRLHEGTPENSCRPAVDVLFRSVAEVYGASTLAVVMTGMGQDGLRGCEVIRERGGQVIAQDQATSVVWGMPGYVVQHGLADAVLPLLQIGPDLVRRVQEKRCAVHA
ncbi:MAG: chemotaxis response regulator protein-glutamate methylesterase [Verrucomicrobiales bacterium]|nr:chemotaxis response regulator protein-glutamate methylesterase [Verrucomicrobiales bacterium]